MDNNFQYQSQDPNTQSGAKNANGLAVASLVCGIISVVMMCCCTYLGIILGIIAIVLGIISKDEYGNKPTMAKVGLVLGIIVAALCIGWIVLSLAGFITIPNITEMTGISSILR